MTFVRSALFLAVVVLIGAGCAKPTPPASQPPPVSAVCAAAAQLESSIKALQDLDTEQVTVQELRDAAADVRTAFDALRAERRDLAEAEFTQLTNAVQQLVRAAGQLPEGTSVVDAAKSLQDELRAVGIARAALRSELGCPQP
jgi:chromosome segregation ATPase